MKPICFVFKLSLRRREIVADKTQSSAENYHCFHNALAMHGFNAAALTAPRHLGNARGTINFTPPCKLDLCKQQHTLIIAQYLFLEIRRGVFFSQCHFEFRWVSVLV